jgi:hypothetical protein
MALYPASRAALRRRDCDGHRLSRGRRAHHVVVARGNATPTAFTKARDVMQTKRRRCDYALSKYCRQNEKNDNIGGIIAPVATHEEACQPPLADVPDMHSGATDELPLATTASRANQQVAAE